MATPNYEYKGTTYEFIGSFRLRREYEKEVQNETQLQMTDIPNSVLANVLEQAKTSGKKKGEVKDVELQKTIMEHPEMLPIIANLQIENESKMETINEKYCYEMLKKEYQEMSKELFEEIVEAIDNEYGAREFFAKVIEKVFTQSVESKKALPNW